MPVSRIRRKYETEVNSLQEKAVSMLSRGVSEEEVARWAVDSRNMLKRKYRELTPPAVLARIEARDNERYGTTEGMTADELRSRGKTWADIIASATHPGRHGDELFGH